MVELFLDRTGTGYRIGCARRFLARDAAAVGARQIRDWRSELPPVQCVEPILRTSRTGSEQAKIQIDVGFGDAVTKEPAPASFPTILDRVEPPTLRIYPPECVVAEKLRAMVARDVRNSRMKDFYGLLVLARTWAFQLGPLFEAIRATFESMKTAIPESNPVSVARCISAGHGQGPVCGQVL
ncbi:MAG: nucleotidyl transferase AbiEii/AbiGii toxin family protein [Bryobacteraceae bacterium]